MKFAGLAMNGYRSFGHEEFQYVGPLSSVTVIAGQNNVGKSNALSMFHLAGPLLRAGRIEMSQLFASTEDTPRGWDGSIPRRTAVGVWLSDEDRQRMRLSPRYGFDALRNAIDSPRFTRADNSVWLEYRVGEDGSLTPDYEQIRGLGADAELATLSAHFTSNSGGGEGLDWAGVVGAWSPLAYIPSMSYLPAMRSISNRELADGENLQGGPLFDALINQFFDYQSPSNPATRDAQKAKFAQLQEFTKRVLDDQEASFEVAGDVRRVFVKTRNGEMQLSRLGTGIEELLILAAAATFSSGGLVCVEEPEVHLHPSLQRQLVKYLATQSDTQFLMSTHSPHVINSPEVSVIHAELDGGYTRLEEVLTSKDRYRLSFSIGARPSDIVQSNFVIWVEGPSDRIYLRAWIAAVDPALVEGAHYSIVFYGGRLLSHLTFDDEEVTSLVNLQKVAQSYAVLIDSDKRDPSSTINDTKQRTIDEASANGSFAWVTAGREVENYVDALWMQECVNVVYVGKTFEVATGQWGDRLDGHFMGMKTGPSKVTVAECVSRQWDGSRWQMDCLERVTEIVQQIRMANS